MVQVKFLGYDDSIDCDYCWSEITNFSLMDFSERKQPETYSCFFLKKEMIGLNV